MAEGVSGSQKLSVNILLPESLDRRLERWTELMPGASWPAWGGHITLIPSFLPRGSVEDVAAILERVCADEEPLALCLGAPLDVQDTTRPGYYALFLTVESVVGKEGQTDAAVQ